MNVCACGTIEVLGSRVSGPHVARKAGFDCKNCGRPVLPGMLCIDNAGLYADDNAGFFGRFHVECFRLMDLYAKKFCGGDWCWPFDIDDAAENVIAEEGHTEWGRDWLLLYEQTWKYGPEKETAPAVTCEDCIAFARCQTLKGVTRFTRECAWFPSRFTALQGKSPALPGGGE